MISPWSRPTTVFYTVAPTDGAEPEAINLGYEGFAGAEWLADGKGIVCVGPRDLKAHPDKDRLSSLYTIDLATGTAKVLLAEAGTNYGSPVPSPDGKWIAFSMTTGGEFSFEQAMAAIVTVGGDKVRVLAPDLDRSVTNLKWHPDSSAVYFTSADRGRFPPLPLRAGAKRRS